MPPTLEVFCDRLPVFSSAGKWLHPLFELEDFLAGSPLARDALALRDRIVGKAAALLIVRLGIRQVHAGVLSRLGLEVFEARGVKVSWGQLVERIACQTESALAEVQDPEAAYALLRKRAGR
jgi:zinc transport system ATP-binding protein